MKQWQRWGLGLLSIGGGMLGESMLAVAGITSQMAKFQARMLIVGLLAMLYYSFGIWSGMGLIKGWDRLVLPSRIFWAFQVPFLQLPHFTYLVTCGLYGIFSVTQDPEWRFAFNGSVGSQFQYSILNTEQPLMLGVNYFALFVMIFLPSRFSTAAAPVQGSQNGK